MADWLSEVTRTTVSRQRGWEILRQMTKRAASTSPISHRKRLSRARSLEKKLATEVEELKSAYPEAEIQLWCEDEHRLGLKPILRRVYVPEGETPIANVNWRFQWLWLYGFVHPKSGETYWWILPYVNTELFNQVLADFAREFKLGAKKHVLLAVDALSPKNLAALIKRVPDYAHRSTNRRLPDFLRVRPRDQAGWHISKDLEVPAMFTFNTFTIPFSRITTLQLDYGLWLMNQSQIAHLKHLMI